MRKARQLREEAGKGLRQLAREANLDPSALSRFEKGEADMRLTNMEELARVLGVTIDDLVAEAEPEQAPA